MGYNEQGFVYPLTLIISLFVTVFITYQIHAYSTEKYVLHEQERLMQLQSLLHVAIHEFNKLEENRPHHETYVFSYDEGTVTLAVQDYHHGESEISVNAQLHTGHMQTASFVYNWNERTITKYMEGSSRVTSLLHYRFYGSGENNSWRSISKTASI